MLVRNRQKSLVFESLVLIKLLDIYLVYEIHDYDRIKVWLEYKVI